MSSKEVSSKNLNVGMTVEINPRSDRSRKEIVRGVISEILTKKRDHPHGVLVNLETGEVGRVKNIIDPTTGEKHCVSAVHSNNENQESPLGKLIRNGENHSVEFKASAMWSSKFTSEDIKNHRPQSKELHTYGKAVSKIIVSKTLAGFLNSDGGTLIIGVKENKEGGKDEVLGIEPEYQFLRDPCHDGYRRMVVDLIKDYFPSNIFNHLNKYIQIDLENINDLTLCVITVSKSDKRVFLKLNGADHFFIRTDASTRELVGEEIIDYCQNRFG